MRICFLCGLNENLEPLDKHHIFGGAYRDKSERDGLYVYLHHCKCHIFGKEAAHNNKETMQKLHEYGEMLWLENNPDCTIEDFIMEYGRNYLTLDYAAPVMAGGKFEITDDEEMPY